MFINLSPDTGPIDIVNLTAGQATTGQVIASNITYKQRRAYIEVEPSNVFSMQIRVAGTTTNLTAAKVNMVIAPNSVYTVWATGFRNRPVSTTPNNSLLQLNYHANRWTDPNRPL